MSDRKAELEKKKAKLQAIREEKERRRREKEQKDASSWHYFLNSSKRPTVKIKFILISKSWLIETSNMYSIYIYIPAYIMSCKSPIVQCRLVGLLT